tara:strand:+ start:420 stop:1034 length:615 start_codon:yes stop_codon:yes gene_type:complete
MDLSFSELKDLVYNASLGSNLTAGISEDLAFAVTFLESRSLPGGKEFLNSLRCERHIPLLPKKKDLSLIFTNTRVVFEGVNAIDLLVSEVCESVILKNIDSSMLLVGLASNYYGINFSFYSNKEIYAALSNNELIWKSENYRNSKHVEMRLNHSKIEGPLAKCERVSLEDITFKKLTSLASNMLVPESEISRATGAGAGSIDND